MTQLKRYSQLCFAAFLQLFFIAVNTLMIANRCFIGVFLASLCVSFIWTSNVKKVVFGGWYDRVAYVLGAASGATSGVWVVGQFF